MSSIGSTKAVILGAFVIGAVVSLALYSSKTTRKTAALSEEFFSSFQPQINIYTEKMIRNLLDSQGVNWAILGPKVIQQLNSDSSLFREVQEVTE